MTTRFSKIIWGDGFTVTDEDGGVIRVDGGGGGGGTGPPGADGADGVGVPVGGTTGQVLTKVSSTDFDTDWETITGGGGGGAPSGPAGGVLAGSYPNPSFAADMATQAELNATELDDLADVTAPSPTDQQALCWDAGASHWVPKTALLVADVVVGMAVTWQGYVPFVPSYGNVWVIPYIGGTSVTFDLQRLYARIETPAPGNTDITLDKSPPGGVFTASFITTVTITTGTYEALDTTSLGTVASGDLIRVTFPGPSASLAVYAPMTPYTVVLEGQEH